MKWISYLASNQKLGVRIFLGAQNKMKKIFWAFFAVLLLSPLILPSLAQASQCGGATGLVPCGLDATCPCEIQDFFVMLVRIFNFAIKFIVTPLAVLMLTIGGILILISAGNQGLFTLGKNTLYAAIIGLVLAFGSWLIIGFILNAIGYIGNWSTLY